MPYKFRSERISLSIGISYDERVVRKHQYLLATAQKAKTTCNVQRAIQPNCKTCEQ